MPIYPFNRVVIRGYDFEDITNVTTAGPMYTYRQALELTYWADAVKSMKRAIRSFNPPTSNER